METVEHIFGFIVQAAILLLECIGVLVLVHSAIRSVIGIIRRDPQVKLRLAEGIELALGFKLGSEVLRTLVIRTWSELLMLGAIVLLRAAITFLIRWEIKNEKERLNLC